MEQIFDQKYYDRNDLIMYLQEMTEMYEDTMSDDSEHFIYLANKCIEIYDQLMERLRVSESERFN